MPVEGVGASSHSSDLLVGSCSARSCSTAGDRVAALTDEIRQTVENHPCYSEDAHHSFARMHVAVAPACNIQCNYCNRKYDCTNEARPGVVSELLTPEQAVKKALVVAGAVPQMSVLGIAGPGDALANPERTFATFRMLAEYAPDITLCMSTNGLMLPEYVDELARHGVRHVTITINCIDPEVGAKIYPWIFWNHRRIRGAKAAAILIERQQKGLEMCVARGILVKVNSVMIPGINDQHLKEVSRVIKAKGAFLHNVMGLIAQAEHGTYYGICGQRGPTHAELQALQDSCAGDMSMMRHCRQCRADAVGMLGEDRGAEFTLDKVEAMEVDLAAAARRRAEVRTHVAVELEAKRHSREHAAGAAPQAHVVCLDALRPVNSRALERTVRIAVATSGGGLVNQHFGHAREFLVYEASTEGVRFLSHRQTDLYCSGGDTCGETQDALSRSIRTLEGCEGVLCSKIGFEPWRALEAAGIQPNAEHAMEPIEEAVRAVFEEMRVAGRLTPRKQGARQSA